MCYDLEMPYLLINISYGFMLLDCSCCFERTSWSVRIRRSIIIPNIVSLDVLMEVF